MIIASLLLLAIGDASSAPPLPPDLAAYIQEVQKAGMTGEARSSLLSVSTVLTGQTAITFPRNPSTGEYGNSYRSNGLDHPPSPDELTKMRADTSWREQNVTPRLKALADKDGSGFVSSREGSDFRRVFEFGLKAAYIIASENLTLERLCKLLAVTPSEAAERSTEYDRIRTALQDVPNVKMPALTLPPAP